MGVFAWFRSKASGRSTDEGRAAAVPVGETGKAAAAESGASEDASRAAGSDDVEIPKQQSAGEAADSGPGEGASS
jgi:hypothetical protein